MRNAPLLAVVGMLAACGASYPPPNSEIAAAQQSIGGAEQAGAGLVPDARLHLQLAREDLAQSKALGSSSARATTLAARSKAEATLALRLTRAAQAKTDAQQAVDRLDSNATK